MFYINPLREEVLHLNPRIVVYHNIINDEEIEKMIELTKPKVSCRDNSKMNVINCTVL